MAVRREVLAHQTDGPPTKRPQVMAAALLATKAVRRVGPRISPAMQMRLLGEGRESGSVTAGESGAIRLEGV